jgi:NitT/TauT family transport system ATP-binding protein
MSISKVDANHTGIEMGHKKWAQTEAILSTTGAHLMLNGVSHEYRSETGKRTSALREITISVERGEIYAIVGPSGCGKSTLLQVASGLLKPTVGTAEIDGKPPSAAVARRAVAFVPQDPTLLAWRTVRANIALPFEIARDWSAQSTVRSLIELVGLGPFADAYPHELSGGMRSRVAIARALARRPAITFLDEPFGSLDEITALAMNLELLSLWERSKTTIVLVTHNLNQAVLMSDRVCVLGHRPGQVVAEYKIDLPRPRSEEMIDSREFFGLVTQTRKSLRVGKVL